jgi:catechol 2,3-dioxygenase-like lactoylglutathione lyase family enzyme
MTTQTDDPTVTSTVHFNSHWIPGGELVPAIERTAAFYCEVFGLAETRRYGSGKRNELGVSTNVGTDSRQARRQPGPDFGIAATAPGARPDDFVRATLHPADIDAVVERIEARGLTVLDDRGPAGERRFRDPEDNLIALAPPPVGLAPSPLLPVEWRIPSLDAAATAAFHTAVLGLDEVSRLDGEVTLKFANGDQPAAASTNPARLTVLTVPALPAVRMIHHASQIVFGVAEEDELRAVVARAVAHGGSLVLKPVHLGPTLFARVSDDAGNVIELVQGPGVTPPPVR